jgi:hypothetical protein
MRRTTILVAGALLAVTITGCGKAGGNDPSVATAQSGAPPSASPSATSTFDPDAPIKYSKCMRDNGMTWFPDPVGGKMNIKVPDNVDKKDFEAAQQACRQWAPGGGSGPKPNAEDIEKVRQMAKCMRENGVPNFPDPKADGSLMLDSKLGIDPESPTFQAAQKKCEQFMPKERKQTRTGGGGTTGGGGA